MTDLANLMLQLMEEEALSEEDARAVAVATLKARRARGASLTREPPQQLSVQDHPNRVKYGDETPAEAKERWMQQEMADPMGLFSGGASAGGVFGNGPIATDNFDPEAMRRTVDIRAQLEGMKTQREMVELLGEMRAELRRGHQEESAKLPSGRSSFGRRLGRKKR